MDIALSIIPKLSSSTTCFQQTCTSRVPSWRSVKPRFPWHGVPCIICVTWRNVLTRKRGRRGIRATGVPGGWGRFAREGRSDSSGERIVVPRRLAVIRLANHPRACYLNGRRYAVTSQLPLSAGSLIAPIGSYTALLRRISGQCRWVFNNGCPVRSSGSVSTMKTSLHENPDLVRG